jgi:hypothetical protein
MKCNCAYYKCLDYGLKPKDHSHTCQSFLGYNKERIVNQELSPYKEEWISDDVKKDYESMWNKDRLVVSKHNGKLTGGMEYLTKEERKQRRSKLIYEKKSK